MRFLLYSHDSYGLGHIRRTVHIADRLTRESSESSALILTGSPRAHYFSYPQRCDYLKLPSVTKGPDGRYVTRDIDMALDATVALRSRLILTAARSFPADVFLADHTPSGLHGEILPALRELEGRSLRVLGLRDVIDEPAAVRRAWEKDGTLAVLRDCYDLILVYGRPEIFDPVREYGIPDDVAAKVRFVGYIGRNGSRTSPVEMRARYAPRTGRLVAVTAGGGGDGNLLMRAFLRGYQSLGPRPPFEAVVVTGPLMSPRKRRRLLARAAELPGVSLVEYCDDIPGLYRSANFVVGMAGYNSVCEMGYAGARALLIPRTQPRREQVLRAERLEARGLVQVLRPEEAGPEALMREILDGLDRPRPPRRWGLDFSGLDNVARLAMGAALPRGGAATPRVAGAGK